jgi:hypothetical protein
MVVASIVSVQGPMAQIDLGFGDGLIEGVEGLVYYELTIAGEPKRIDVGRATITAVDESSATIRIAAKRPVYSGQQAEFEIAQAQSLLETVPPEPVSSEPVSAQPVPVESPPAPVLPAPNLPIEPVAQPSMDQSTAPPVTDGSSSSSGAVVSEMKTELEVEPPEAELPEAKLAVQESDPPAALPTALSTIAMNKINGGSHWVGLDRSEAGFFNQTPRIAIEIDAYRIDLELASDETVLDGAVVNEAVSDRPDSTLCGLTYDEAEQHCAQRGARLPTEYEWEVAASQGRLEFGDGLLEWTASWYQAYPGNSESEPEYGQRFRVLRGSPAGSSGSPHERRFMAPGQRNSQVGFRCVEETP